MQNIINGLPIAAVILLLAVGFAFLVKGADFFVEGSSSIVKKLKVPPIIIGLTIVAMGTSLPETAVSVTASLVQNNELAVSNVVGSNIFNLMFVIGVCSILTPIMVQKATVVRDIPLSLGCALVLLVLGISGLGDKAGMTLGHADGVIFLIVFAGYIFTMVRSAMKARAAGQKVEIEGVEECDNMKELSYGKSILFLIADLKRTDAEARDLRLEGYVRIVIVLFAVLIIADQVVCQEGQRYQRAVGYAPFLTPLIGGDSFAILFFRGVVVYFKAGRDKLKRESVVFEKTGQHVRCDDINRKHAAVIRAAAHHQDAFRFRPVFR